MSKAIDNMTKEEANKPTHFMENGDRAISLNAVKNYFPYNKKFHKWLDNLPSVTTEKTGHWIPIYQGDEIINYRCSECELGDTNGSTNLYGWDYCRRCGAKMIEPQESEG